MDVLTDDFVGLFVGIGDVAHDLIAQSLTRGLEGKRDDRFVPRLYLQLAVIDAVTMDPRRGTGLKTAQMDTQLLERFTQSNCFV